MDFKSYKAPMSTKAVRHPDWTFDIYVKRISNGLYVEAAKKFSVDYNAGEYFKHFVCDSEGALIATDEESIEFFNSLPNDHVDLLAYEIRMHNEPYTAKAIDAKKKKS